VFAVAGATGTRSARSAGGDVLDRGRLLQVEEIREDRAPGERAEGQRRDELPRGPRHHDGDADAQAAEVAEEVGGL
jgi:hypothetical protein